MKRAFLVWPALCWQFFTMLAVAAYLTAAAILCARARSSGACAGAAAAGLALLPALGLTVGAYPGGGLTLRLVMLFERQPVCIAFLGQIILAVYLLARWLRYR